MTVKCKYQDRALLEPSLRLVTKAAYRNKGKVWNTLAIHIANKIMHQKPFSVNERLHLEQCSPKVVFSSVIVSVSLRTYFLMFSQ